MKIKVRRVRKPEAAPGEKNLVASNGDSQQWRINITEQINHTFNHKHRNTQRR